jgi:K+-sensing histidine kinase KdpD
VRRRTALRRSGSTRSCVSPTGSVQRRVARLKATSSREILKIARRANITQIVIGRPRRSVWTSVTGQSLPDALVRRSREINVHLVSGDFVPGELPRFWPASRPVSPETPAFIWLARPSA